jgi:hypothetical protein
MTPPLSCLRRTLSLQSVLTTAKLIWSVKRSSTIDGSRTSGVPIGPGVVPNDLVMLPGSLVTTTAPDKFIWKWSPNQQYSASLVYKAFYLVQCEVTTSKGIHNTRALPSCKFFMWLALLKWCWTSEQLRRHNTQNSGPCALCLQIDETIHHLLLRCVYSWDVWFLSLQRADIVTPGF